MKYECEAFDGAFVEFSERWTRGETRRFWGGGEAEPYWALVCSKITACNLPTLDGGALTDPATLDNDALDALDIRLFTWLANVAPKAVADVQQLGEAIAASLWTKSETAKAADD